MSTFIQAFLLPAVIFVAWKLYQLVFARTALDNIRGPPSRSFLNGEEMSVLFCNSVAYKYLLGNFLDIFNPNAWKFHQKMAETCKAYFMPLMGSTHLHLAI